MEWTASFQTAWRYKTPRTDVRQMPPSGQRQKCWKCTLDVPQVAERAHYNPSVYSFPLRLPYSRWSRSIRSLFHEPFFNFRNVFPPMPSFGRNFFGSMMDFDTDANSNEGTFFFFTSNSEWETHLRDCVHVWLQTGASTRTWSSPNPSATAR